MSEHSRSQRSGVTPHNEDPHDENPPPDADAARQGMDARGQTVHGPQTNIQGEVNGPVFSGNFQGPVRYEANRQVTVGNIRGVSGGTINIAGGDIVQDATTDHSIKTGDITNSTGVAIGHGARASVTQISGGDTAAIAKTFASLLKQVDGLADDDQKEDARDALQKLEAEAHKGEEPNEGRLRKWLNFLADMSPDIFEVATAAFTNPASGLSAAFRKIAERAKEARPKKA